MRTIGSESPRVVVTSPSFSRHALLRNEMIKLFPGVILNDTNLRLSGESLATFLEEADAAIIGLEKIDESVLSRCNRLKIIAKYGVGLDNIDLEFCRNSGIAIGWTGGVNRLSVAEMTLGFMLALCRNLFVTSNLLSKGTWEKNGGCQLSGKTVGIIGAGNIGREVIRLLQPFGCRILVNDIIDISLYCEQLGLVSASPKEIFSTADIVTLHTPLNDDTHHLVSRETLSMMKPSAFLINTSRGGVVCQDDLSRALQTGSIAGAAIDVYEEEPPSDLEFLSLPNLICTPHIGGNSAEAVLNMGMSAIGHLKEFFGK